MTTLAIVGATGQVGRVMRDILETRDLPLEKVRFFASARSAGSEIEFRGGKVVVEDVAATPTEELKGIDIALFSAGGATSKEHAPASPRPVPRSSTTPVPGVRTRRSR